VSSIEFCFEKIKKFSLSTDHITKYINKLIINELKEPGDIAVIFCSDEYLLDINKKFLNHDYYTDIITFDYVFEDIISGDLFISIDRIKENSQQYGNELVIEVYRVIFHGILHLIGYKDKSEKEKYLMKKKEDYYLSEVDFSGQKL
jgi:probable rRNA maturation factor